MHLANTFGQRVNFLRKNVLKNAKMKESFICGYFRWKSMTFIIYTRYVHIENRRKSTTSSDLIICQVCIDFFNSKLFSNLEPLFIYITSSLDVKQNETK